MGLIGSTVPANSPDEKRSALVDVAGFRAGKKVEQPESERYALEEELTANHRLLFTTNQHSLANSMIKSVT